MNDWRIIKREYYWTGSDGAQYNVDKMDKQHLRNTLKLLMRHNTAKLNQFQITNHDIIAINKEAAAHGAS